MPTVELWSNWACASGVRTGTVYPITTAAALTRLDGNDALTIRADDSAAWLTVAGIRSVLRVTDDLDNVSEWRIRSITDVSGREQGIVTVVADPPIADLGTAGLIRDPVAAGRAWLNLGFDALTPEEVVDTFVLTNLTEDGLAWLAKGTIGVTDAISIAWDRWTRLQLVREIASRTSGEFRLRRNGDTSYLLDILAEGGVGSTAATVLCQVQRNILDLTRERNVANFCTVAVPAGIVPQGAQEVATIARACWAVSTTTTANVLTLADPEGKAGPLAFNGQVTGKYILKKDATLTAITTSVAASQQVTVADATGIAAGDHVEIRADASGAYLLEMANPSAVTAYGRVVQTVEVAEGRGERNHIVNPLGSTWTINPAVISCQANTTQANVTSVAIKGLGTSTEVKAGDRLYKLEAPVPICYRVTGDVTANASGEATISIPANDTLVLDGQGYCLFRQGNGMPTGWVCEATTTGGFGATVIGKRATTNVGNLSCQADGAQTLTYLSDHDLNLKGLTAGSVISFGDVLNDGSTRFSILGGGTASASGTCVVIVGTEVTVSVADNAALTVERPSLATSFVGPNAIGTIALKQQTIAADVGAVYVAASDYTIKYDTTMPSVWASAGLSYVPTANVTLYAAATSPCTAALALMSGATLRSWVWDDGGDGTRVLTAGAVTDVVLRAERILTADESLTVRVIPPRYTSLTYNPGVFLFVRWVSLHVGSDAAMPPIDGSHANNLWREGNAALSAGSGIPTTYRISLLDLAQMAGYQAADEALVLGGMLNLVDTRMGIDVEARIVELTYDLIDPNASQVVIETAPTQLSSYLRSRVDNPRQVVQLNVATTVYNVTASGTVVATAPAAPDVRTTVVMPPTTPSGSVVDWEGAQRATRKPDGTIEIGAWTPPGIG